MMAKNWQLECHAALTEQMCPQNLHVTQSSKRHAFSPNLKKFKYPEKETSVS